MRKAFYSVGVLLFLITNCISLMVFSAFANQKKEIASLQAENKITKDTLSQAMSLLEQDADTATAQVKESSAEEHNYILKLEDDQVHVYHQDGNILYEETSITCDHLPAELQEELKVGKVVASLDELYSFLESYSS